MAAWLPAAIRMMSSASRGSCLRYPTHSECDSSCRSKAETTHSKFLHEFGVSSDDYPLLKLDVSDWNSPFSVA